MRGAGATAEESALLRDAFDACCEDPDMDVLVSGAGA
jgi:exonuclease SbcD